MTSKKKRQRGTRTRGGGSHKHNRGAGHSGGRGAAGRDKHEYHNHQPLGKRQELHVTADAFTAGARAEVEQAGGSVALTERAEEAETDDDTDEE